MLKNFKKIFNTFSTSENRVLKAKLIACDLDGTLLNGENQIGTDTAYMISKIQNLDIPFIIITRRHHQSVVKYLNEAHLNLPIIGLDGATFFLSTETPVLVNTDLDQEFMLDIVQEVFLHPTLEMCVVSHDRFYLTSKEMVLPMYHRNTGIKEVEILNYGDINSKILEILLTGDFQAINSVLKYVEDKMHDDELKIKLFELKDNNNTWVLEIRSFNAKKENGLKQISGNYGVKMNEVIGIGDYYNDIGFCNEVGYVVAVENAIKDIKDMADFVTSKDHRSEGVNEFLEYFLNIRGAETELKKLTRPESTKQRERTR